MKEKRTHKRAGLAQIPELLYTACIGYMMITQIMHSTTQLPYTGIVLIYTLIATDILLCQRIYINKHNLFIWVFYLIGLIVSLWYVKSNATVEYVIDFICFVPMAAYISGYDLEHNRVKRIIRNLAIIFVFFYLSGLMQANLKEDYFNTGLCILPGILSLFVYTWDKMKNRKYIVGISCTIILAYASRDFLSVCSRGSFASYMCFVVIFILIEDIPKWIRFCGVGLLIACIYIAIHLEKFVRWGYNILQKEGIEILFFTKSMEKLQTSTISSQRNVLFSEFFRSDFRVWVFGRGIGGFEKQYGIYTHNIVLSKWSDFGFLGLIWILFLIVVVGLTMIKEKTSRDIFLIILGASFFPLMFSFTYWSYPCFFLLEFLTCKYFRIVVGYIDKKRRWKKLRTVH